MSALDALVLFATGILSGGLGGLLGVGGGVVVVPVLLFLLPTWNAPPEQAVHLAVATSLATVVFTNLSSAHAHWRSGNVSGRLVITAGPAAALAGIGGALLSVCLPGELHQRIFGGFLILVALRLITERQTGSPTVPEPASACKSEPKKGAPSYLNCVGSGAAVGTMAGLLGIGGGSLAVPLFHLGLKLPVHQSVGSSAAVGLFGALLGTLGHALLSPPEAFPPGPLDHRIGFILWPAALAISLLAVVSAQLGARLANRIPPAPLRRGFGVFLLLVGVRLLT